MQRRQRWGNRSHQAAMVSIFATAILLGLAPLGAQQVGTTTSVEDEAQQRPLGPPNWLDLWEKDPIRVSDQVRTLTNSKLSISLANGDTLNIGNEATLQVGTSPLGKTWITIQQGDLRVLTGSDFTIVTPGQPCDSSPAQTILVVNGLHACAAGSSFIASCNSAGLCHVIGVYGQTILAGLARPLDPQEAARIDASRLVTRLPPMPDAEFQRVMDATTVVGTGPRNVAGVRPLPRRQVDLIESPPPCSPYPCRPPELELPLPPPPPRPPQDPPPPNAVIQKKIDQ